jgi:hypothetical protein
MLHPGESFDGYRLIRPIGSGGFGQVWLCQSEAIGDFRALKFIPATGQGHLEKEFDALCRYRTACRVGAAGYSAAPLSEPDLRVTHPALCLIVSRTRSSFGFR